MSKRNKNGDDKKKTLIVLMWIQKIELTWKKRITKEEKKKKRKIDKSIKL